MHLTRHIVAFVLWIAAAGAAVSAEQGPPVINVTPFAESESARPGTTVRLALRIAVPPGIHIQSDRPRDPSLIPAVLSIDAPSGVKFTDVVFPKSTEFRVAGFDDLLDVFEGEIVVGARLTIEKDARAGMLILPARFRYQACNENTCFAPTKVDTSWTLQIGGRTGTLRNHDVFASVDWTRARPVAEPAAAPSVIVTTPAPAVTPTVPTGDVLALFDRFTIAGTGEYMNASQFVTFVKNAEAGIKPKGMLDGRGPLAILAIVFIGGLALNLTPCVLPMIPINLAIIGAGASNKRRGRGFVLGSAYGAAMALVYGALGVVVILTAGTFGTLNASPWFNIGIALLFVFLALAMFDVVSLDFSRYSSNLRFDDKSRGSVTLAFTMGAVAALLAGACVAPVVVQVVIFASQLYASGTPIALALPFVLGLGMAVPWPLAGAGMSALPRPGAWMVRVKQVMGVFILATAAYYGYVGYETLSSRWVDPASVKASVDEQVRSGWHEWIEEGLRAAERDRTRVLIDFWASWCKNCLVMDRTTLKDPAVTAAISGYTRIKFQAEDPESSPSKELMRRIGAVGLPAYVILEPKSSAP